MSMKTLNMIIGNNFGKMLTDIAKEKLYYDYSIIKAIDVLTKSLVSFTSNDAIDVILGKKELITSVETQELTLKNIKHVNNQFKDFINNKKKEIDIYSISLKKVITGTTPRSALAPLNIAKFKEIVFNISKDSLIKLIELDDKEDLLYEIENNEEYAYLKSVLLVLFTFKRESIKFNRLLNDLYNLGLIDKEESKLPNSFYKFLLTLDKFIKSEGSLFIDTHEEYDNLKSYIQNEFNINQQFKNRIEPVDITELYDAGWLAPNGDFYGINGDIANMLHIKLADKLVEDGIITKEELGKEFKNNPDTYLRQIGWITIHNLFIHSDLPSLRQAGLLKNPKLHLTEEQQHQLYLYGQHKGGILKFGILQTPIVAVRIPEYDRIGFEKLFLWN